MPDKIYNVEVYKNERCPHGCIRLFWDGPSGFGQYDLVITTGSEDPDINYKLIIDGHSEGMDDNEDKTFIKELLMSLIDHINVIG